MVKHREIEFLAGGSLKSVGTALEGLQETLEKTVKGILRTLKVTEKTTRSVTRPVAAFDQLEKLSSSSKTTVTTQTVSTGELTQTARQISAILTGAVNTFCAAVEEKLRQFAAWNGGGIVAGLAGVLAAVSAVQALLSGDKTLPLWLSGITNAFSAAESAVSFLGGLLASSLSPALGGVVGLMRQITTGGLALSGAYDKAALSAGSLGSVLGGLTAPMGVVQTAAALLAGGLALLMGKWNKIGTVANSVWEGIQSVWSGVAGWFGTVLFDPLGQTARWGINGVIACLNGLSSAFSWVINGIVGVLNRLSFTVPDWIPGLGGKRFGFQLQTVTTPKIPYLAQGAVLPANRPFLAMVGDQKHGTNVEAPLTTIQDAVSLVMGEQTNAIMAGFEASITVQKEILEAVLGIHIGDSVIGQAVQRYEKKLSAIRGGAL